jgi:hypothetical protein
VELPGQENNGNRRKKGERQPAGAVQALGKHCEDVLIRGYMGSEALEATQHGEGHEQSNGHEGHELHNGFNRDCQDHPVLMLGRINVARAEQDGEDAHGECHQNGQAIGAMHDGHDGIGKQRIGDHGLQRR